MYLDAFTLSALVDEFMDVLVGGRVQDSIDVDDTGLGLEVYARQRRRYLYMSADSHTPRIHLLDEKLRRGMTTPRPLNLLFRRMVEGGVITHVSQPTWERIIQIDVEGPEGDVTIIVEPMERRSNLLLVQNKIILDCLRRVGPDENRYRLSLPQHEYMLPPPQVGKLDPTRVTLPDIHGLFEQNDDPKRKTQQVLSSGLLGMSPLLAREVIHRAGGATNQKAVEADPDALYASLGKVVEPLGNRDWQPGVVETDEGVEAFSVYPITHLAGWHPVEEVSAALTQFYGAPVGDDAYKAAKVPIHAAVHEAESKLRGKLASLERSLTDERDRDVLRQSGELILAYQYTLEKGQTELHAEYEIDKPAMVIPIDPTMTPLENAQKYFERYDKAKRALDDVPRLVQETRYELAFLAQLDVDLEMANNWPEIDEVQQALQTRGYWRGKRTGRMGGGKSAPLRVVTPDGFVVWVGRNSRQNEQVTFEKGSAEDWWLHARDVPGAHLIVKFDGRRVPENVIERAAQIAAYYSANRANGSVIVDVTQRKYVKKIKGGGPGMVTYRNETTRSVTPRSESESEN